MKKLDEIMGESAKITAPPDGSCQTFDLSNLTEQERAYHIEYAIEREKMHYASSLAGLGASRELIAQKISMRDWMQEIDVDKVLQSASERKRWHEEDQQRREQLRREAADKRAQLRAEWTAARFYTIIKTHYEQKHENVLFGEDQLRYFKTLSYWMAGDERLLTELGCSLNKGLLVAGGPGQGKTETLKAVRVNPLAPLHIYSMIEITDRVREAGDCTIRTDRLTVLDDVGSETVPVKYYGTEVHWFKDFIETLYLKYPDKHRNFIITTNLDGDAIQAMYGYRVRSRLREMFNVIKLNGKDYRK